jgi:cytochrome P450 family 13
LALLVFHLAKSPAVQEKLREEIGQISGTETPDYANLNSLKYLNAVVKETLRLYPVGAL